MLRCLSLTVIIENFVYIIFDIIYSGLTLNIVFFLMIIEAILFGYYLSQIKNGMVSHEKFTQARKAFMATCIMYILYFIVTGVIIIVLVNDVNPHIDTATIIIILIISTLIFLIPRFIGLCVTKNVSPQHVMLIPNRWFYVLDLCFFLWTFLYYFDNFLYKQTQVRSTRRSVLSELPYALLLVKNINEYWASDYIESVCIALTKDYREINLFVKNLCYIDS